MPRRASGPRELLDAVGVGSLPHARARSKPTGRSRPRLDLPLITRDADIERWGQVRVVW